MRLIYLGFIIPALCYAGDTERINDMIKAKEAEVKTITAEKVLVEREVVKWKKVKIIYNHYKKEGSLKPWLTPDFLYRVISFGERYRYLTRKYNYDSINPENFYLCWLANESSFNPLEDYICRQNDDGSIDLWIMQMNNIHYKEKGAKNLWRRVERINPELKGLADYSVEKNIAVWSLWLGEQKEYGVWKVYTKWERGIPGKQKPRLDVIKLYEALKEAE